MSFDANLFCRFHLVSNVDIGILSIDDLDHSETWFETLMLLEHRSTFLSEISNPGNVHSSRSIFVLLGDLFSIDDFGHC